MSTSKDFASVLTLDGLALDGARPMIPATWPALMRGEGIFEAFLVTDSCPPPMLEDHDARLCLSAELAGFAVSSGELRSKLSTFLPLIAQGQWRVRCSVLRGEDKQQHWLFSAGPEQPAPESAVLMVSDFRLDPFDPMAGAKTISRAALQRARELATAAGAFEALLLTIDGDVAEGASTNIFVYADGKLKTPTLSRGILGGVTRLNILRSCKAYGIACEESRLELDDLATAEEVYISNAVIGLIPITKILKIREDYPGVKGSKLIEIRKAYRRFLESTLT